MSYAEDMGYDGLEDIALLGGDFDSCVTCTTEYTQEIRIHIPPGGFPFRQPKLTRESEWIQRDGTPIKVKDMATSHIKNSIKLIYKSNGSWRREFLRVFEKELRHRKFSNINMGAL